MATTGRLRFAPPVEKEQNTPAAPPTTSWMSELINQRGAEKRKRRNPVGFDFSREPFDPSSYYKSLGMFRDVSRAATNVVRQEVANREEAQRQAEFDANQRAMNDAMGGVNPNFTYSGSGWTATSGRNYKLGGVTKTTQNAANYYGNKYGVKEIGGYRSKGSVPGSDHPKGRALDFMTYSNKKKGTAIANDLIKNYKKFKVSYVIWNRYIWSPGRGWRKYNGPSPHTDHVHASFTK